MNTDELTTVRAADGFEGYEDRIEGDDQQQGGGVIHGALVRFTNEASWVTRDGVELPPDLELAVVDIGRVVQKWADQRPAETIILEPGQKFPDLKELNAKVPRDEWTAGPDGNPRGPWQSQHIVYLLDLATMDRYSFPTGTTGGAICVRDLVDKTKWMRQFRGANVFPVVSLSDAFMNTRFGGRQRPHLLIKRWVNLGGDEEKALPAPEQPAEKTVEAPATTKAAAPTAETAAPEAKKKTTSKRGATRTGTPAAAVEPPSLSEEMDDVIPF